MSPAARQASADLAMLLAELSECRRALARHRSELASLEQRWPELSGQKPWLAFGAVALHGWYTAFESLAERVARTLDGRVPTTDRWHRELLAQMTVELPGIRPGLFDRAVELELAELLKFRHFFRHAYNVALDVAKVAAETRRLLAVAPRLDGALDVLEALLRAALTAVSDA